MKNQTVWAYIGVCGFVTILLWFLFEVFRALSVR